MNDTVLIKTGLVLFVALILYGPELFPRCACCGRIKPRRCFLFHICTGLSLTRRGDLSLCKKCCRQNGFSSVDRFKKQADAHRRAGETAWWQL